MYQHSRLNSDLNFFQKIKNLDFILLFCIIVLSTLSFFIMYSTDGGELLYHSKSHLTKLITFLYFDVSNFFF
jgi:rod shape determining protein RodA